MRTRREAIEEFCYSFLMNSCEMVQSYRNIYKSVKRLTYDPSILYQHDIGVIIQVVGDELFSSRPATLPYVTVYLEFVSDLYEKLDLIPIDKFILHTTIVLEKTSFNPQYNRTGIFRHIFRFISRVITFIADNFI